MTRGARGPHRECPQAIRRRILRLQPQSTIDPGMTRVLLLGACLLSSACSGRSTPLESLPGRAPRYRPERLEAGEGKEPPVLLNASFTIEGAPLVHRLPSEQQVNTPVPLYFEPPAGVVLQRATVRYKPFGASKYKTAVMRKLKGGFGVEVPCTEVTTTGDLKYYIEIIDEQGRPLDSIGSETAPLRVHIKNNIEGGPPSFPGYKPPGQCAGTEDAAELDR